MKKWFVMTLIIFGMGISVYKAEAQIPIIDIIKKGVKKVIKAIDLKIQRQQNKVIWLQNAQKVLENSMSKLKLKEISSWTEKQKELYSTYFEDLKKVKSLIAYYQNVRQIIKKQELIVQEYQRAWSLVRNDKHFTKEEIEYIGKVYSGILSQSVDNMEGLYLAINSFKTQMTDAKRIELINTAFGKVDENYTDLKAFNNDNAILSLQRAKSQQESDLVKSLYGIK